MIWITLLFASKTSRLLEDGDIKEIMIKIRQNTGRPEAIAHTFSGRALELYRALGSPTTNGELLKRVQEVYKSESSQIQNARTSSSTFSNMEDATNKARVAMSGISNAPSQPVINELTILPTDPQTITSLSDGTPPITDGVRAPDVNTKLPEPK
eukprot:NODE_447_length_7292_cov_0.701932.p5 type:complete len:154 gc:universal NODE_447_length_7292_cov_0.701932:963-502(-)